MAKYKHKGSVTTHQFEKLEEPEKTIDWDALWGAIFWLFLLAIILNNCAG